MAIADPVWEKLAGFNALHRGDRRRRDESFGENVAAAVRAGVWAAVILSALARVLARGCSKLFETRRLGTF